MAYNYDMAFNMRISLILGFSCLLFTGGAQVPAFQWARPISGEIYYGFCADSAGNLFTMGYFTDTTDFDHGPNSYTLAPMGESDIYVAKYGPDGSFKWAVRIGGPGNDHGWGITTDADCNVYLCGNYSGTVDMDPGVGVSPYAVNGDSDAFLLKLDSLGNFIWVKSFGGVGGERANTVKVDLSGNIYVSGSYQGTVDFDPGKGVFNLSCSADYSEHFILKLNPSGNFIWAKSLYPGFSDFALSSDGRHFYAISQFVDTRDFDPGLGTNTLTSFGGSDVFVCKMDSSAKLCWVRQFGGVGHDYALGFAVDAKENIYSISMYYKGTSDFDPGPATYNLSGNSTAVFAIDSAGKFKWAKDYPNSTFESITAAPDGRVFLSGSFQDSLDFDPGPGESLLKVSGMSDLFILNLDPNGKFTWVIDNSGNAFVKYSIIVIGKQEKLYVTANLGGGSAEFNMGATTIALPHLTYAYPFMLSLCTIGSPINILTPKKNLCIGESVVLSASGGENYQWDVGANTNTVSVSPTVTTTYQVHQTTHLGCVDSRSFTVIVDTPTLSIKISPEIVCIDDSATIMVSGASTYTWNTGAQNDTIVLSGPVSQGYTVTGTSTTGCTSKVTYYLEVNSCTSLTENSNLISTNIYPNPASSILVVEGAYSESVEIKIFDLAGQCLYYQHLPLPSSINVSHFKRGVYILSLKGRQFSENWKIVKD